MPPWVQDMSDDSPAEEDLSFHGSWAAAAGDVQEQAPVGADLALVFPTTALSLMCRLMCRLMCACFIWRALCDGPYARLPLVLSLLSGRLQEPATVPGMCLRLCLGAWDAGHAHTRVSILIICYLFSLLAQAGP